MQVRWSRTCCLCRHQHAKIRTLSPRLVAFLKSQVEDPSLLLIIDNSALCRPGACVHLLHASNTLTRCSERCFNASGLAR